MSSGAGEQGNRMKAILETNSRFAPSLRDSDPILRVAFPTLKRGANDHCASGAMENGTSLVNKKDSCDHPARERDRAAESRCSHEVRGRNGLEERLGKEYNPYLKEGSKDDLIQHD